MAMARLSAGILFYRRRGDGAEVLLVHPGGPFWARRDAGAWSIPKGEFVEGDEDAELAARREFTEETGWRFDGPLQPLGRIRQAGGKTVVAFAAEADFDTATLASNHFEIEWPPRSGRMQTFPEVDRAAWFSLDEAWIKILAGQRPLLDAVAMLADFNPPRPR
jgi:predicted NUDIX family NTP pyrophosphohydrolase